MAIRPVIFFALVPLIYCSGVYAADPDDEAWSFTLPTEQPIEQAIEQPIEQPIADQADQQTDLQAAEPTAATQPASRAGDNHSAFARAISAAEKRRQAGDYWQAFQRTNDDADLEKSLAHLAEAIALSPDSKSTWQLAATIHYALRNIPAFKLEAINSFEKLLQLDAQDLSSRILLIDELISIWRWPRAILHLETMFSVNQAVAVDTVLDRLVISYLKAGQHEHGADFLKAQLANADNKEPLIIALAIMEQRAGQTDVAVAHLGKVLFSNTATKAARAKARQLKIYWQENERAPDEEEVL